eukprot:gene45030-38496_t
MPTGKARRPFSCMKHDGTSRGAVLRAPGALHSVLPSPARARAPAWRCPRAQDGPAPGEPQLRLGAPARSVCATAAHQRTSLVTAEVVQ